MRPLPYPKDDAGSPLERRAFVLAGLRRRLRFPQGFGLCATPLFSIVVSKVIMESGVH